MHTAQITLDLTAPCIHDYVQKELQGLQLDLCGSKTNTYKNANSLEPSLPHTFMTMRGNGYKVYN
jgi:hypothetical protein